MAAFASEWVAGFAGLRRSGRSASNLLTHRPESMSMLGRRESPGTWSPVPRHPGLKSRAAWRSLPPFALPLFESPSGTIEVPGISAPPPPCPGLVARRTAKQALEGVHIYTLPIFIYASLPPAPAEVISIYESLLDIYKPPPTRPATPILGESALPESSPGSLDIYEAHKNSVPGGLPTFFGGLSIYSETICIYEWLLEPLRGVLSIYILPLSI
jgi:hypothetical protein